MYWVELHCDVGDSKVPYLDIHGKQIKKMVLPCYSDAGESPGVMVSNQNLTNSRRRLIADAKAAGWNKSKAGWACPNCKGTGK